MKPIYESIIPDTNTSFKVETYGYESNCVTAGWHIHPEYEIVYVKNGAGVLRIANKSYPYKNGVLVFLGGNIPHSDFGNHDNKNGKEVVVQFSKEFVDQKLVLFPELSSIKRLIERSKYALVFDNETKAYLSSYFEQFNQLDNQGKFINLLSILNHLSIQENYSRLLHYGIPYEFREKETHRLESIFEYINAHYDKKITVKAIAEKVGLTPNSFSRFFKKVTNKTFIDFINEFRIRKAMDIFNQEHMSITEVMYLSGFSSPSYFTKQFVKYQKMTPSTYLKKCKSF